MAYDCYSIPADSAKVAVDEGEGTAKVRFVIGKIATQWKNFKKAMKEKRSCKRKVPSLDIIQKEEIVKHRSFGQGTKVQSNRPARIRPFRLRRSDT